MRAHTCQYIIHKVNLCDCREHKSGYLAELGHQALMSILCQQVGPLLGYIIFCQAHIITVSDSFFLIQSITSYLPPPLSFIFRSSLILSSLWTLKFFQFNIPPFCISSKMTGIHVHMLSLIPTLYLLFLFVITYLIMDCNVQYTSHLSRPWKLIVTYYILNKKSLPIILLFMLLQPLFYFRWQELFTKHLLYLLEPRYIMSMALLLQLFCTMTQQ